MVSGGGVRSSFRATYRLQLTPEFGFAAAQRLIPYLRDLGISHLYLSPSLQARPGSTHGYDVIDPTRISSELGGEEALRRLAEAAHQAGLGIILDVVPNHMATDENNRFWSDPELRPKFFDVEGGRDGIGEYRRFFDIDELAGVRQEDPEVFAETHRVVLNLVREGIVDGLRIDHPDGMSDPAQYFRRLREAGVAHVWIEKILEAEEELRDWPVTGTVGYEFLNDVCALFVDTAAEEAFTDLWQSVSGDDRPFATVAAEAKLEQALGTFERECRRLARIIGDEGKTGELARAAAGMPIYRTYVEPESGLVTDDDRRAIDEAGMPGWLAAALTLEREAPAEFVSRFQQTSPPVVAKGVEDTAFYRHARLLALNDVGGDPGRFGLGVGHFHARCRSRAQRFPQTMLTTVTHDTKRTADVRARIAALTWMPEEWAAAVRGWMKLTEELRSADGAPDDSERYFIFQTLAGAWPIEAERIEAYMEKALREAKRNTSWVDGNEAWERGVRDFCRALYSHRPFLEDFEPFVAELSALGDRISLATVCLKLTTPGVPDIYQGDEVTFRALVDPDNRRAVDWDWNRALLARLQGGATPDRDTAKLWLTMRLLHLRLRRPDAFAGDYVPLDAGDSTVAFLRGGEVLVVAAARPGQIAGELAGGAGTWRDVLRGERRVLGARTLLGSLLGRRGLAVLERTG
ncbi:MAG: (1-_4)-alpha-D-glucan 1-alpha-D-glucosylmutase [Solirubrobacteraceae bacterium]|jgi:(1->4)-alpha-D-glucan 1-alpha-D-glucosylmutase|nr:(1->4)-alpha-D-glucan 1-alpha-D-glucosylmutase [Solirubrobacteraceae bacterium]